MGLFFIQTCFFFKYLRRYSGLFLGPTIGDSKLPVVVNGFAVAVTNRRGWCTQGGRYLLLGVKWERLEAPQHYTGYPMRYTE